MAKKRGSKKRGSKKRGSKKRGSKKGGSKKGSSKKRSAKSIHIPLSVLEKRARRLNAIVKARGGTVGTHAKFL